MKDLTRSLKNKQAIWSLFKNLYNNIYIKGLQTITNPGLMGLKM